MEEYIKSYHKFNKTIVYDFNILEGGIGDNIKFFIYILELCINHKIKLYYLINNILIEKYIKLIYEEMYILVDDLNNPVYLDILDFDNLDLNKDYLVKPYLFYDSFRYNNTIIPNQVFYFHNDIILNSYKLLKIDNYFSIHVRLGDKYLETESQYIQYHNDQREFDEEKLFRFIEENYDKNLILFSDNKDYKLKIKKLYNQIIILDTNIGHTALTNTTEEQVFDTITEFYIMSNSEYIYISCHTGFSIMASKFNNISTSYVL